MTTPYGDDEDLKEDDDLIQNSKPTPQQQTQQLSSYNELYSASNQISNELSSTNKVIGYGILGCAGIASKIARAIHLAPNSQITCVASRSLEKAQNFVSRNCPNAEAMTYDELILSDKCQIIYIPIPTALRLPWIVKAIEQVFLPFLIYIKKGKNALSHNKPYLEKAHIM